MAENDIFKQISRDLGIHRGTKESLDHWQCRLAYSAAAWRGLTCLWEHEEGTDGKSVLSMQNILSTIEDTLSAFGKLFSGIQTVSATFEEQRKEKLSEHIRGVLQKGACFYHKANRAAPVAPVCASEGGISFLRGLAPQAVLLWLQYCFRHRHGMARAGKTPAPRSSGRARRR